MSFRNSSKRRKAKRLARLRRQGKALDDIAARCPEVAVKLLMRTFIYPQRSSADDEAQALLKQATHHDLTLGKRSLRVYEWKGKETDRPTVSLFHDYEAEAGYWHTHIRGLREMGCTVYAIDAPASGASQGQRLSLSDYINALHAFFAAFGSGHTVVGHGLGGAALVQTLAQLPARQRPVLAAVLGVNATSKAIFQRRLQVFGVDERVRLMFWKRLGRTKDVPLSNYDNTLAAARLGGVEGLVIHDRHDARYPIADAQRIQEAWPEAQLLDFEGFGHQLIGTPILTRVLPFVGAKTAAQAKAA